MHQVWNSRAAPNENVDEEQACLAIVSHNSCVRYVSFAVRTVYLFIFVLRMSCAFVMRAKYK